MREALREALRKELSEAIREHAATLIGISPAAPPAIREHSAHLLNLELERRDLVILWKELLGGAFLPRELQ